jgi:hypothetical protein
MKEALSSSKRRFLQEPHGVTSQKTPFFIVTAVKTSNLTLSVIVTVVSSYNRLCSLVFTVHGYRSRGPGFDSLFWNGVHSAS